MSGWRGDSYLDRDGAARSYEEARDRARRLKAKSWRDYLDMAPRHNLPTQPQTLWPDEWEAGGRYAGFIGTAAGVVEEDGLVSGEQFREEMRIGYAVWRRVTDGLRPDRSVSHKDYYEPARLKAYVLAHLDGVRVDAQRRLIDGLSAWP